jgi:hypothetical protein
MSQIKIHLIHIVVFRSSTQSAQAVFLIEDARLTLVPVWTESFRSFAHALG